MKKRLQTILSHAGAASRRKAADLIESGNVRVDGKVVREKGLKMDPEKAGGRLRKAWVKAGKKLGEDGIVVAEAAGKKRGREARVRLSFYSKNPYFMTGLPTAISVRAILEDKVRARGLNLLCNAVDPAYFLAEFEKTGVTYELVES